MDRSGQLRVLGGVAADQWGLVTAAQAKAEGLSGVQLKRLTEAGLLENVGHGVYLLPAAGQPRHLEIKVAWLRLQPEVPGWQRPPGDPGSGVVSHASACQLLELGDIPAPLVEISVPRRRTTTDAFVRLRTAPVEASEITIADGLPVTVVARTVTDLLRSRADGGHIGGVIADAEQRGLVSLDDLADRVQPFARSYGLSADADGRTLIEHLVDQAGESLHAQQVGMAAQQGFVDAVHMFANYLDAEKERWSSDASIGAIRAALESLALGAHPSPFNIVKLPSKDLELISAAMAARSAHTIERAGDGRTDDQDP